MVVSYDEELQGRIENGIVQNGGVCRTIGHCMEDHERAKKEKQKNNINLSRINEIFTVNKDKI